MQGRHPAEVSAVLLWRRWPRETSSSDRRKLTCACKHVATFESKICPGSACLWVCFAKSEQ
jgi:hypothetical protein